MANLWNNAVARHIVDAGLKVVDITDLGFTSSADYWVFVECGKGYVLNNSASASPPIVHRTKSQFDVQCDIAPMTVVIVPLVMTGKKDLDA